MVAMRVRRRSLQLRYFQALAGLNQIGIGPMIDLFTS
jgi:hypothetical protein